MSDAYWRYNDGRQQQPAVSAFVGKFPRTDYDVQSGRDMASYYPRDDERLTHCTIRGIGSINQSYDSYLRNGQLYPGVGTVRLPGSGLSNHAVEDPRIGSDPRMGTDPRISGAPHIMSSSNNNSVFNLRPVLEKNKLNGENFLDWERNLRIVLRCEGKESVLDTPIPEATSRQSERAHRQTLLDNSVQVTCLMLACMEPDLQKRFDGLDAYNIIQQLKTMFQRHVRLERFEVNRKILECRLEKGTPVGSHVFNMIGHFQHVEKLGFPYPVELSTDIILNSLHDGFKSFRLNFYMQGVEATLQELHGMLIQAEKDIPQKPVKEMKDVLMVQKTKSFKKTGALGKKKQGKNKQVVEAEPFEKPQTTPKQKVAAEHECFYCHIVGHWKRNCPKYLEDKKKGDSTSGTKTK